NPAALVPVLEDGSERIAQSLAIIEYLDERYPESPLLPASAADRAWVRQIALDVACDIHPLNNLRVLKYLTGPIGLSEEQKQTWIRHWIDL
ncbi:UNVERIFIED_CONTAM: glutathione S-transferase N-terminal domain-containing protein, partial [Salmonella enterica subsp. enterica serovar Weltevreden]